MLEISCEITLKLEAIQAEKCAHTYAGGLFSFLQPAVGK
jgi:hypothetical protein